MLPTTPNVDDNTAMVAYVMENLTNEIKSNVSFLDNEK